MSDVGGVFIDIFSRLNLASATRAVEDLRKIMRKAGEDSSKAFTQGTSGIGAGFKAEFAQVVQTAEAAYRDMEIGLRDLQVKEAAINRLRTESFGRHTAEMISAQQAYEKAAIASHERIAAAQEASNARIAAVAAPRGGREGEEPSRGRSTPIPMGRTANVIGAGSLLTGGVIAAESLKIDAQAEGKLNDILTRFQDNAQNVQLITQGVYKIAGQTGTDPRQLADAAEAAEQAGYKGQQVVQVVETAAKAAKIAHTDVKEALSGLTTTMADFHIKDLQGTPEFLERMNDAAGKFVVTIANLKDVNPAEYFKALANIEPVAGAYMPGVDSIQATTQVDAIAAILSQTGMPPERGMLNLAQTVSKFGTAKGTAAKSLEQLGLPPEQIATQMRDQGILPVLTTLNEAIEARKGPDGMYNMGWKFNDAGQLKSLQNMDIEQLKGMGDQGASALEILKGDRFQAGTATNMDIKKEFEGAGITDPNVTGAVRNYLKLQKTINGPSAMVQAGVTPELTKAQVVSQLAGTGDVQRNLLAVLEHLPDVKNLQQQYQEHGNAQGLENSFTQFKQSLPGKLQILEGQIEELAGALGQKMLPGAIRLADDLNQAADWLDKHKAAEQAVVDALVAIGAAWAGSKVINMFDGAIKAMDSIGLIPAKIEPGATALAGAETVTAGKVATMGTEAELAGAEMGGSGIGGALKGAARNIAAAFSPVALAALIGDQIGEATWPLIQGVPGFGIGNHNPANDGSNDRGRNAQAQQRGIREGNPTNQSIPQGSPVQQPGDLGGLLGAYARGGLIGYDVGGKVADPYSQPLMGQPDTGGDSLLGMLPSGVPVGLRGGEGILTPEAVAALGGKDGVDSLNSNPFSNPMHVATTFYGSFAKGVAKYSPWGKYLAAGASGLEAMEQQFDKSTKEHEGGGTNSRGVPHEIQEMLASGMPPQQVMQALGITQGKRGGLELPSGSSLSAKDRELLGLPPAHQGGASKDLISALRNAGIDPRMYPMLEGFAKTEGMNPSGAYSLGFTDSQAGTTLDEHARALAAQLGNRQSAAGPFPVNGTPQEQASWMATVVGQNGVQSDWQGNAQPSRQDYVNRVAGGFGNGWWGVGKPTGHSRGGIVGFADGGTVDPNGPLGPSGANPNDSGSGAPGFDNPNLPDWWKQRLNADLPIDNAWMPNNPHDWGPGMPKLPWMSPSGGRGPMMGFGLGGILPDAPPPPPPPPPAPPGLDQLAPKDMQDAPKGGGQDGPKIYTAPGGKPQYHTGSPPNPGGGPGKDPGGVGHGLGHGPQPKGEGSHPSKADIPKRVLIPEGTQPKDDRKILDNPSQPLTAEGKGFGVGGGLLGAAESAASSMGGPMGAAAQPAFQLMNRAIGYGGQLVGIGIEGLMETFLPNDSPAADPSKNLFGKIALGIAGAHPSGENRAGGSSMALKPKEDLDAGTTATKQQGGGVHIHGDVHNHGQQEHEGMAKAVNKALFGGGYLPQF